MIVATLPEVPAGKRAFTASTRQLRAFVEEDNAPARPPTVTGTTAGGSPWSSARLSWRRVTQGDGWAIFETSITDRPLPVASTLDDPRGAVDFTALGTPDQIVRIYGTRHLLP